MTESRFKYNHLIRRNLCNLDLMNVHCLGAEQNHGYKTVAKPIFLQYGLKGTCLHIDLRCLCEMSLDRIGGDRIGGGIQTLSVTFTLRTSLKDIRGHSNRTSGDILTGCPAMFYFCILT